MAESSNDRAEAVLDLLESDFGQSGRDVRLEALRCEFAKDAAEAHEHYQPQIDDLIAENNRLRAALAGMIEGVRELEIDPRDWHLIPGRLSTAYQALGLTSPEIAALAGSNAHETGAAQPGPIVQEPMDYLVQCRCGWRGHVSELAAIRGFKMGCPRCSAEFVPFDKLTWPARAEHETKKGL